MMLESLSKLIAEFRRLPGVGQKTGARYAYRILEMTEEEVNLFASSLIEAKAQIHFCKECGNYTDRELCERCQTGDKSIICVVEEPKDITAFEKTRGYNGLYHVLHGSLDFQRGIGADDIRISELISRLSGVNEVIIATNPDISGEMTANYLAQLIKPLGIKVTRLAHGLPMGSEIEYADEVTLLRAMSDRREM